MSTKNSTVKWNGAEYDEETFATATRIAINSVDDDPAGSLHNRTDYLSRLGRQYSGDRDIYDVLGYPKKNNLTLEDYRAKYERGIGRRIVELPAQDSWKKPPKVTDTPGTDDQTTFDREVKQLVQATKPWHYLRRADSVAGIGQYGALFIGYTDNAEIDKSVDEGSLPTDPKTAISHYQPFAHDSIEDWRLGKEKDLEPSDPKYNEPVEYKLDFGELDDDAADDPHWVHWTRVLHVPSDGRDESDLIGTPRLKTVYNRLVDLEKVVGASAEIFWTGAAPRYQFNVESENAADIPEDELAQLDSEVQKLVHDMQNYIKTFNTDLEVISGEEVDPTGVHESIMSSIAGTKGIPKRILMGSERGELASTQDRATWLSEAESRRTQFNEPVIARPFLDRQIGFGILSEPQGGTYDLLWPNLFELNEVEQSEVEANRAEALASMAPKGNTDLLGEFDELMEYVKTGEKPDLSGGPELPPMDESNEQVRRQFGEMNGE